MSRTFNISVIPAPENLQTISGRQQDQASSTRTAIYIWNEPFNMHDLLLHYLWPTVHAYNSCQEREKCSCMFTLTYNM
jgi:hypothetical protein